ncbi:MAG: type II toxin-antitoxin system RelE family toxin [Phycisphaerales bacterium]
MSYTVELTPAAAKSLRRLQRTHSDIARRIADAIDGLAAVPRPPGVKKLQGDSNLWHFRGRIRVNDFRILYEIHDKRLLVLVVDIGNRRDVYR